ncbi:MAG: amidohydrolase family protein [Planctomycetota bacterium]
MNVIVPAGLLALAATLAAQETAPDAATAFVGARVLPVTAPPIEDGVVIVRGKTLIAVGTRDATTIPADATRVDVAGKTIMPGLICTHSHVGGPAGADRTAPLQPECRVLDSLDVRDAGLHKARAGGLTTLNIMPGSGHLLSGQTVYVKLRRGGTIDELLIRLADGSIAGGIKMANGTNPMRKPPFPGTRAKSAALVRALFTKAQRYRDDLAAAASDPERRPARDLALEPLVEALAGRRVIHHHTHRHDDILTVLRLAKEFGLRVVLHHVSDAVKVADEIAAAGVPCSIIVLDSPGGKIEAKDLALENGAALERAGVATAFHTDDGITDSRVFLRMAALAVRAGMSRDKALEGLTLVGAQILELEDRIGSLDVGKDADLVVLSGDPFSVYTKVEQTWIEGRKVFDRSDPDDRLYAEGGDGASTPQAWYLCCFENQGN